MQTDDLDGPGHNGDGTASAEDPDEFQHPAMGPPGSPCVIDAFDPTPGVDVQCAEPGPPTTTHKGGFGTCTMHPSNLHAVERLALLRFPAGGDPLTDAAAAGTPSAGA